MNKTETFKKNPYNVNNRLITESDIINIMKSLNINDFKINNIVLYQTSFIHKSYCRLPEYSEFEYPGAPCLPLQEKSYETMEFLGDSILGSVVSSYIYNRFYEIHNQNEGFLTKLKIRIVCGETLSKLSSDLKLQEHLVISRYQEEQCSGRRNLNMLEDVFESLIGAIYLDHGYQVTSDFIIRVIERYIDFTDILLIDNNYKDQISRYFQQVFHVYPKYENVKNEDDKFICRLYNGDQLIIEGEGKSKKKAEQDASKNALVHFNVIT